MLTLCGRLAVYLELAPFPLVDIGLLASRYIVELNLPSVYFILSKMWEHSISHVPDFVRILLHYCNRMASCYVVGLAFCKLSGIQDLYCCSLDCQCRVNY